MLLRKDSFCRYKQSNAHRLSFLFIILLLTASCKKEKTPTLSLWYLQPAEEWMQATPAGNGRLGAMIYGGTETETIALNEITLWSGQYDEDQEISCGKEMLGEIRRLFFDGKIDEGNRLGSQYLYGKPHSFGTHLPLGDLKIKSSHDNAEIKNYKRELDLEKSITTVSYSVSGINYKREYFCSNPDDVFLIKFTSDKKNVLNMEIGLDLLRESVISTSGNTLSFSGQALFPKLGPGGVFYTGMIHVASDKGTLSATDHALIVNNSNEVTITIDIRTDYKNPSYKTLCEQTIRNVTRKTYEEIKTGHIKDYTNLFDRAKLYLGESEFDKLPVDVRWKRLKEMRHDDPGLFALFFQYGRYLLISSSRENSPLPANLQGLWNDNLACNMSWTCDYHLDINTQQNYWLANTGNLHECHTPLFNYLEDLAYHGEKTAAKVYGSPGWTAHTVANVWGYTAPGQGVGWGMFPTAGVWLASHLWSHYTYTLDMEFLRNKAYPILKKSALFLLDYLVEDPAGEYLMTGPSISPENSFKVDGREYSLSMMPACDRVLVHEALESCIEASEILGVDAELRQSMVKAIAKLPPVKIGKDGTIQEWFEDYELAHPNHRHSSHLLALYPYCQITLEKTPELAKAAEKSVYRQLHSRNWEDVEWSRANMICFYARLKNAKEAYKNMKGLLIEFSRENLFTMSPAGIAGAQSDIFEFDANEAAPAAIAEMLIQSHEGYIEFLPALPEEWSSGYFKGLCVRGGAEADLQWNDSAVEYAKITATVDNRFSVKLPHPDMNITKNGRDFTGNIENGILSCRLNKGDRLELNAKRIP
ncbi:MAG: glycoside hydrolase family 95 protein [Tannerella sp.]|nr:glycoside hydrolase family 95 protein [Tannerella sp.]